MTHLEAWLVFGYFFTTNVAALGGSLFYWAKPIANEYDDWFVRNRQRFPKLIQPKRTRSSQSSVITFRILGAIIFVEGVYGLLRLLYLTRR